ncbi:arsenate reductase family protein [Oceanomicrobium pacificus]|uniref:ArsC family transcriptional regulator n=1 Tax=Oceanomicrobium pacificus TaxID=2692916 RepID=A0A6B0TZD5_9RHOB|nr:ArsC/Spx/MgsR family protein [Oceanomicrobium pacificus]MXU66364.1 ArsC family transcriptional regulator [Oceanomicrobium pacificus]
MSLTLHILKNCDSCRAARRDLTAAGQTVELVDIMATPPTRAQLDRWLAALGPDRLVNRKSATWRGLGDSDRDGWDDPARAAALLQAHPKLMKRPLIEAGDAVHVGWTAETRAALGL